MFCACCKWLHSVFQCRSVCKSADFSIQIQSAVAFNNNLCWHSLVGLHHDEQLSAYTTVGLLWSALEPLKSPVHVRYRRRQPKLTRATACRASREISWSPQTNHAVSLLVPMLQIPNGCHDNCSKYILTLFPEVSHICWAMYSMTATLVRIELFNAYSTINLPFYRPCGVCTV